MEEEKKKETDLEDEDLEDEDIDESLDGGKEDGKSEEDKSKEEQEKAERARQAKLRREREAKAREAREKEIREKALLEGELKATSVNTFTNKPIKDEYDLKVFKLQKEIESEGGDPISDLPERLAKLEREKVEKAKKEADERTEGEKAVVNDLKDFRSKYPDVNVKELLQDPDFKDYTLGRLGIKGGMSLANLYESFNKLKEKYGQTKKEEDDGKAKTPSPNGGRKHEQTSYSKMTEAEKINHLRKQGLIN